MIKIAYITKNLEINGISTVILNYINNMDLSKYKITIFAGKEINDFYKKNFEKLHVEIVELPSKDENVFIYYKELYKKMKKNNFDILHVHGNSSAMAIDLIIGKIKNIKIRIAHCHNTKKSRSIAKKILYLFFNKSYTKAFACGNLAGESLFGKKDFFIMRNGIDTHKYKYNRKKRVEIRKKLGLSDEIVLGHIGRFNTQKNQAFLIDVFDRIASEHHNYVLLLIGTGPDFETIKRRIMQSKYKDRIILYGETEEPEKLYLAMDIFVFPSLYEGLPLTLVEAQISGLNCIVSDVITDEVIIGNVEKYPINDIEKWKSAIVNSRKIDRESFFDINYNEIKKYSIKECAIKLEKMYSNLLDENSK